MNEFVVVGIVVVLALQLSMMKREMLALQRRGRPLWLAMIPLLSFAVIAFDAIANRIRGRGRAR